MVVTERWASGSWCSERTQRFSYQVSRCLFGVPFFMNCLTLEDTMHLCSHKMSETTHPMMQHHVLESCNTQPHHLHKCINIFHTVSNNTQYTKWMPNLYQFLFTTVLTFANKLLAHYRSVTLCPPAYLCKWSCQQCAWQWTVKIKLYAISFILQDILIHQMSTVI